MESREAAIQAEIDQLVSTVKRDASAQLKEQIQSYARKVFASGAGRPNTQSIPDLKEKLVSRVNSHFDQRTVLQCQETTQRFLNNPALPKKQEALRMLVKLSELNELNQGEVGTVFAEIKKRDLNQTTETNASQYQQQVYVPPKRISQVREQVRMIRNKGSVEDGVTESEILKALCFSFTNTGNSLLEGNRLKSSLKVSQPVKRTVSELCRMGWMHERVKMSLEREGVVRGALNLGLRDELSEFYRWIACIENMNKDGQLTLRKLKKWAFQPAYNLQILTTVVDAVAPLEGAHIISAVNSLRPDCGEPETGLIQTRILSFLMQPLFNYIDKWAHLGELYDPNNEFFIAENPRVSDSDEWHERFSLVAQRVPNVLDLGSARKIFMTGKNVFFLRNRCKVLYKIETPFFETQDVVATSKNTNLLVSEKFTSWLNRIHDEVNRQLVQALYGKFHLTQHLASMKHFFLMGKMDFVNSLVDSLCPLLSRKKYQVTENELDGFISDSILQCFRQYQLPDGTRYRRGIVERLLAKKIEYGGGSQGWDCFNFQYSLQEVEPLLVVLSPQVMMNYQKIFGFLWRIKQIQKGLHSIWKVDVIKRVQKLPRNGRELYKVFHVSYGIRSMMIGFIFTLSNYLLSTIHETIWAEFEQKLRSADSFDAILATHLGFQREVLEVALCTPKCKSTFQALSNVLMVISNFRSLYLKLSESFDDYYERLRLYQERLMMEQRGIVVSNELTVPEFSAGKVAKEIQEVKICYEAAFRSFYSMISKEGTGTEPRLKKLAEMLDSTEYYSARMES